MSGYLITWDVIFSGDIDLEWVFANMDNPDLVQETEDGYLVFNFPDLNNNQIPDFIDSGAGSGLTNSQNIISG